MLQAFVASLFSTEIQRCLLEKKNLDFSSAYRLAVTQCDGYREVSLYNRSAMSKQIKPMVASTSAYDARLDSDKEVDIIAAAAPPLACYVKQSLLSVFVFMSWTISKQDGRVKTAQNLL